MAPKGTDFPGLVSNGRPFFYNPVSDTLFGTVSSLKAFERNSNLFLCVYDYCNQSFVYNSEKIPRWLCKRPEDIKESGVISLLKYISMEDQQMLINYYKKGIEKLYNIPESERCSYALYCSFKINADKRQTPISMRITPITLTECGDIWLILCAFSISSICVEECIVAKYDSNFYYEYTPSTCIWEERERIKLSELEGDILVLSARGFNMEYIGKKLYP